MRILIDECVDPRIKLLLEGYEAITVHECNWDGLEDALLLQRAQDAFDVLLTIDRGLEFQQNIQKLRLGIVIIQIPKNQIVFYRAILNEILSAIREIKPGSVVHVPEAHK